MDWADIPDVIDTWTEKLAHPAYDLRTAAAGVITTSHVGYYIDPLTDRVGIFAPTATAPDAARCKAAALRATGREPLFLSYQDLDTPAGTWVKVGHSPALRRAGELLNFFPGQLPGGLPNAPSPLAAMLTSGLLGAGLGYGAGRLIGGVLPAGYGDRLGRTGAVLGGALGAAPGALWAATNKLTGRGLNDPGLLDAPAGAEPVNYPEAAQGTNGPGPEPLPGTPHALEEAADTLHQLPFHKIKLGSLYTAAAEKVAATFGRADRRPATDADVNIDHLGRTLWDTGASPALAATTMGGLYAAQQLPDPRSRPGWVTGNQLGQLAANAAGDYATGYLVGKAINLAVGTPYSAPAFGTAAAALGVLGAVVPRLFGG